MLPLTTATVGLDLVQDGLPGRRVTACKVLGSAVGEALKCDISGYLLTVINFTAMMAYQLRRLALNRIVYNGV